MTADQKIKMVQKAIAKEQADLRKAKKILRLMEKYVSLSAATNNTYMAIGAQPWRPWGEDS